MSKIAENTKLIDVAAIFSFCIVQVTWADSKGGYEPYKGIMEFKHPAPWLETGGDFRFRFVYDDAGKLDGKAIGHDRINTPFRGQLTMLEMMWLFFFDTELYSAGSHIS